MRVKSQNITHRTIIHDYNPKLPEHATDNTQSADKNTSSELIEKKIANKTFKINPSLISEMQLLDTIGITEFLEQDERPSFIIDLMDCANFTAESSLKTIFANMSLRSRDCLLELVTGNSDVNSSRLIVMNDFLAFKYWALSFIQNGVSQGNIPLTYFRYANYSWTCNTLRKRIRVISGNLSIPATNVSQDSCARSIRSIDQYSAEKSRCYDDLETKSGSFRLWNSLSTEYSDHMENLIFPGLSYSRLDASENSFFETSTPNNHDQSKENENESPQHDNHTREILFSRYSGNHSFDWTRNPESDALPRHIQFVRDINWASTALGPIKDWGFDLRTMCNLVMSSPHPAAMYWGDQHTVIYNEAYILLAGQKHPQLLGQKYAEAWPELWSEIESIFLNAKTLGQSMMKDNDCLFIRRNGYLEESYFTWCIIPLLGEDGSVVGLYNPAFENTRQKIVERRTLMLREVGQYTATARNVKDFWSHVLKGLDDYEYDVPFALIYSVGEHKDSEKLSMHGCSMSESLQCVLEGTLGVPAGHPSTISPLGLKDSDDTFTSQFREAMKVNKPILLTTQDDTLSEKLIEGLESRGFGDPCRAVVICPIRPTTGDIALGFLVMGINPRRPFDDDYSLFIQLLNRQLATSMASVMLIQEEIRLGQQAARLAALDRQKLHNQLDMRTKEAVESETKFTRMAALAPVGIFIADSNGDVTYNNEMWWEISRHPRTENSANTWMESILDTDRGEVEKSWKALVENKIPVTIEFRFKTTSIGLNGFTGHTWVLMSAYPEKNSQGQLKSVFGSITNISQQKWAEDLQKRRMEEAIEMKRQQENFIDMTSHEMRNPLSAILQCSEEITTSLIRYKSSKIGCVQTESLLKIIDRCIDASQTIALCAQHQRRIIDDVLTLSKLDAALLLVIPAAVQPISIIKRVLKIFEGELGSNDIALEFRVENSYSKLNIDHVKLDPSRLLQVLINLTTNAIKFTGSQSKRNIIVSIGASLDGKNIEFSNITYFPSRSNRKDPTTDRKEWGDGEPVYLHFAVEDTGRGLDENETTLLFQRFSQASPRTHVHYGGSGLGLFISRELTELQGGEIGVSSKPGIGSTFAFYVKARRVDNNNCKTPGANFVKDSKVHSSSVFLGFHGIRDLPGTVIRELEKESSHKIKSSNRLQSLSTLDYNKLMILIVEDNLVNQRILQKQLTNLGFQTAFANHGGEALEFLKKTRFWKGKEDYGLELSLILMDLEMPIMDGLTCARLIREAERKGNIVKHVPLIAVTANARLEQIEMALAAGMDDVQTKPFLIRELIPKIEVLITN